MNLQEIQEAVKEVMGKDPHEVVANYYRGLIQHSADIIAQEQKNIRKLKREIDRLTPPTTKE